MSRVFPRTNIVGSEYGVMMDVSVGIPAMAIRQHPPWDNTDAVCDDNR